MLLKILIFLGLLKKNIPPITDWGMENIIKNNMSSNHIFKIDLKWAAKSKIELANHRRIVKNHSIKIAGKPDLNVSAAKAFKGDPDLYNPEDLLLSSLASCHMMSYLYCCEKEKIEVLSYSDDAEAILEVNTDEGGRIVKVILNPKVIISDANQIDLALSLHTKANHLCFIANSCNFPVEHYPVCITDHE
jgi:organic hydroperoxide reductase OsmC/OhrA